MNNIVVIAESFRYTVAFSSEEAEKIRAHIRADALRTVIMKLPKGLAFIPPPERLTGYHSELHFYPGEGEIYRHFEILAANANEGIWNGEYRAYYKE